MLKLHCTALQMQQQPQQEAWEEAHPLPTGFMQWACACPLPTVTLHDNCWSCNALAGYGGGHNSSALFGGIPLPPLLPVPLPAGVPAVGAPPSYLLEGLPIPHFNWDSYSSDEDDLNGSVEEHAAWQEAMSACE